MIGPDMVFVSTVSTRRDEVAAVDPVSLAASSTAVVMPSSTNVAPATLASWAR
jgi:hypothetical protein